MFGLFFQTGPHIRHKCFNTGQINPFFLAIATTVSTKLYQVANYPAPSKGAGPALKGTTLL